MHYRTWGAASLRLTCALIATPALAQDDDYSKVEIKADRAGGNVLMFTGAGGNIGVSHGPDGILIIDDQFAPLAPKISAALAKVQPGAPRFVINTHWHGDHTGGNKAFGRTGTIIAHTNVRTRMQQGSEAPWKVPPAETEALPVITFGDALSVHWNGEEIRLMHLAAGHTDGDSVIHFTKSNVVHMGDLFFNGMFPFIDLGSGGSIEGYLAAVEKVLATLPPGVKIIPGHGPLADKEALARFAAMLKVSIAKAKAGLAAGKSLATLQKEGLGPEWKSWGEGFINTDAWIETLYKGLGKH